jgi:hypothetical protein
MCSLFAFAIHVAGKGYKICATTNSKKEEENVSYFIIGHYGEKRPHLVIQKLLNVF